MAVELGRERIRETAGAFGILAVDTPEDAFAAKFFPGHLEHEQRPHRQRSRARTINHRDGQENFGL